MKYLTNQCCVPQMKYEKWNNFGILQMRFIEIEFLSHSCSPRYFLFTINMTSGTLFTGYNHKLQCSVKSRNLCHQKAHVRPDSLFPVFVSVSPFLSSVIFTGHHGYSYHHLFPRSLVIKIFIFWTH